MEIVTINPSVTRREFLKTGGALVITFALPMPFAAAQSAASAKSAALDQVDGFLAIDSRGMVKVFSGKVDLGTGVKTAIAQMAAEELDVPFAHVEVIEGDTMLTPDQGPTYGSLSIQNGGMQIRQAAATARAALVDKAAKQLGVGADELTTQDGAVVSKSGQRIAYAELVDGRNFELKVDAKAKPKDPAVYGVVGKSVPRVDIPDKVSGEFVYMQDFVVPQMLHARVIRPAAIKAKLLSFDDSAAKKIPGFVQTVREGNFLAVVAANEWAAIRAARAIKSGWSKWEGLPDKAKLFEHVRNSNVNKDEVLQTVGTAPKRLRARASSSSPRPMILRSIRTVRSAHRAQWRSGKTTRSPFGPPRSRPTSCANSSRPCSAPVRKTYVASISKARVVTGVTDTRTPRPMPRSWQKQCRSRCACSGCATTSTAGIRKARPPCSTFAARSTAMATSSPGNRRYSSLTSPRQSP